MTKKQDKITATFYARPRGSLGVTYRHTVRIFGDDDNVTGDWRKDFATPEVLALYVDFESLGPTGVAFGLGVINPILTKGHW